MEIQYFFFPGFFVRCTLKSRCVAGTQGDSSWNTLKYFENCQLQRCKVTNFLFLFQGIKFAYKQTTQPCQLQNEVWICITVLFSGIILLIAPYFEEHSLRKNKKEWNVLLMKGSVRNCLQVAYICFPWNCSHFVLLQPQTWV